jgi:hypothetical protein
MTRAENIAAQVAKRREVLCEGEDWIDVRQRPRHVMHLVLTLCTGGLWLPFWLLCLGEHRWRAWDDGREQVYTRYVGRGHVLRDPDSRPWYLQLLPRVTRASR